MYNIVSLIQANAVCFAVPTYLHMFCHAPSPVQENVHTTNCLPNYAILPLTVLALCSYKVTT